MGAITIHVLEALSPRAQCSVRTCDARPKRLLPAPYSPDVDHFLSFFRSGRGQRQVARTCVTYT